MSRYLNKKYKLALQLNLEVIAMRMTDTFSLLTKQTREKRDQIAKDGDKTAFVDIHRIKLIRQGKYPGCFGS